MKSLLLPPSSIIHGNSVVLGHTGILITGNASSGKSSLSSHLVREWIRDGNYARQIADDQVVLAIHSGRLIARPAPFIAGRSEIYHLGIVDTPYQPAAIIDYFVQLLPAGRIDRMPEPATVAVTCSQSGIVVHMPCIAVPSQSVVIANRLIRHLIDGAAIRA